MSRAPITSKGARRLRAELDELKSVKRPAVILAIAEARAHGDLKENAEYHAAREQQSFNEGRIGDLEADIKLGLIAISSPVARALIGKHEGDVITIEAPAGTREYEIVSVKYLD